MEAGAGPGHSADFALNVRFGPFELDVRGGELHKEGRRIRLQEQPFQILRMLLESPGAVVSREEIRQRLWPDNTVVEFDHSINAAVKRLRDALRDSAEKPRYIETVARRGYRFIAELRAVDKSAPLAELVTPTAPEPVAAVYETEVRNRETESVPSPRPFDLRPRILIPAFVAAVILMIWVGVRFYRDGAQPFMAAPLQPLMRLDLDLSSGVPPSPRVGADVIISPDGTRLVYVSQSKLFTRRLDQAVATELPGTEKAEAPFISPDGRWVGFFAGARLKKVSLQTGQVIDLCRAELNSGASWGEDGNIVTEFNLRGLSRIPSAGGAPSRLTQLAPGEIIHRWPQVLPGARAVLFSAYSSITGLDGATIQVISLRDGHRKTLVRGGTWGRYLISGHLVYVDKGTLFAVPFDLDKLELHGSPTLVLDEVAYDTAWGSAQIAFSRTGSLVYRSSKAGGGLVTVQWLDNSGNTRPIVPVPGNYLSPTLSPDGSRLALTSAGDIWVYELGRGSMTRLTSGGGYGNPLWTVDGRYILFRAAQGIFWTRVDGASQPQALTSSGTQQIPWSFTGNGKRLAFVQLNSASRAVIWTVPVNSDASGLQAGKPEVFLEAPFNARSPIFSPDGRWIAYQSDESGGYSVDLVTFPDKHGKQRISSGAGYPAWSRNGHELFFWKFGMRRNQLMVTSYKEYGDSFVADKPHVWSENRFILFSTTRPYDPAPDGKHVVALMPAETAETHDRVIFLLNFFDELRRRAPLNAN
jgi:serine/threonine-protein kinase